MFNMIRATHPALFCLATLLLTLPLAAQQDPPQTGSSSSSAIPSQQIQESTSQARIAHKTEAGGSAITLENSEPLFDIAVALNACGYDADLAASSPVRLAIREEVNEELRNSAPARDSRDAICLYIRDHTLADKAQDIAQYVSLALYTTPPPALAPSVGETELPPDSTQVVNILPLLRAFNEQLHLHALYVEHLPDYQALNDAVHGPLTKMVLSSNIAVRMPTSGYDGRRFLVLLEPMLAPSTTNARIYATDYIAVASPNGATRTIHMDQVRHIYLQYVVEPLIYARAAAMDRLLPLLKPIHEAPIDFIYRSDISAYITECLIRAIEARLLEFDFPRPAKPNAVTQRTDMIHYDADVAAYEKKTEALRRELVERDMRQGWALTEYFYNQLLLTERDSTSLKEDIGQMVYGMDVDRERKHESQIAFYPEGTNGTIRRTPPPITGIRLAEMDLMKGDLVTAEDIAQKILADPKGDHPEAHYVLAQVELMQKSPEDAMEHFTEAIKTSKNPRTLAWSHIYLGRLYDTQPDRPKAIEEYKAALTVRDSAPDTKAAAEKGIKAPFATPRRAQQPADDDNTPLDPSGKAEKEAYRPDPK
ncbi:Tetratricopeptide repeat protein [Granulicella sibirica]|uniref:Tetratricopeptide repeat protein n=2 Tax=Granulicella sibirica TaxID=2479048 RepID=A0A4Q0SY65_9BACT|nr:Tetratricopeptide repeat protein [Granulicella sibirica]